MSRRQVASATIDAAVMVLRQGGVIAYPTETFYGLGVDPFVPGALERLHKVKQRDAAKPVLVLIDRVSWLARLVSEVPPVVALLAEKFWPGPLTLVLPARFSLPQGVTGMTKTVGVRISSHPVAAALVRAFGGPVTSTSANIAGHEPLASAREVKRVFGNSVDLVVDGGRCPGGSPSTLVAVGGEDSGLRLLRPGVLPYEEVEKVSATFIDKLPNSDGS